MNLNTKYVLDANVFIEASRRYYAFDIAPNFWNELLNLASQGIVVTIDKVYEEIQRGKDELAKWLLTNFQPFVEKTDTPEVLSKYKPVVNWAQNQSQYTQTAKNEFQEFDNADAWLVAFAAEKNLTIVTHEQIRPNAQNRILIPNACQPFQVTCIDTFVMLRTLGIKI